MLKKLFSPKPLDNIVLDGVEFSLRHRVKKNMKRMILRVEKKNHITLSSSKVSKKRLEAFIYENTEWILQQQEKIKEDFELDSSFFYLGKTYCVKHHLLSLYIEDKSVFLNPNKAKIQTDDFYKISARKYIPMRLEHWKNIMGLEVNKLGFRLAKKRWGSCNSKGSISLNPYMMKLSYEMIDYIIIHELSHLVHLNHSKEFYNLIQEYMPHHQSVEKEIKRFNLQMY